MEGTRTNTRLSRQWQEKKRSRTPPLNNLWSKHWACHMATIPNLPQLSLTKHRRHPMCTRMAQCYIPTTGTHKLAHKRHTTKLTTPYSSSPTMRHGPASNGILSMNVLSSMGHSKGLFRNPTERTRQEPSLPCSGQPHSISESTTHLPSQT